MTTYGERALKFRNETARKLFVVERKKTNLSLQKKTVSWGGRGLLVKVNLATESYTKETIRMACDHDDFVIGFIYVNSPPPSGSSSDPKVYSTPEEVITNGKTDIIIVGRGIYASGKDVIDEVKRYRDAGWNAYLDKLRISGKDQMNFLRNLTSIIPPIAENTIKKTTKYGGKYTVTLIPGDGIGPEIAESVKTVFKEAEVPIEWEQYNVTGYTEDSDLLFQQSMESLRRNKVALKDDHPSFNVAMRKYLDIYASLVLINNIKGYPTRHKDVDFVIIRENTEGEYAGLEHQSYPGVIESLKITTREKTERIARFAFDFALKNGRKKVTCVHKANIMKLGDGLFLNTCRKIAEDYKPLGIEFDDMIVDNCSMQLVSKPQQFDVMVMPNLYGAIVSNIGAALVGGPGIVPGVNIGREYALFEPGARHVGRDIQGDNKANPTAFILSGVLLLRHLGLDDDANRIYNAVIKAILHGSAKTHDMGGNSTTTEFTHEVISNL
ncbi:13133_t:CDS:10 [Entrophospora sp. SA101]|nr:13133_t:CDS:10 [Entrophospora sp. SA101]